MPLKFVKLTVNDNVFQLLGDRHLAGLRPWTPGDRQAPSLVEFKISPKNPLAPTFIGLFCTYTFIGEKVTC